MKKNGFTLIEVLGVIVILSVLSLITIPVINKSLNQGKDNLSQIQKNQIIKSLKNYYAEHLTEYKNISTSSSNPSCKTVNTLKAGGYLPTDLKDPKTKQPIDENTKVCAYKQNSKVTYLIKEWLYEKNSINNNMFFIYKCRS